MTITQLIGWIGAIAYVVAYLLLSLGVLKSERKSFHVLNALGALCLIINAMPVNDYPTIAVNVVWGLIAILSIFKIIIKTHTFD
ncbi:CBU_0592 family membrane protein [Aquimarina longa]|uniref:CBU_0592 family membrane protein n=1 Tax=Aquimarina longa TaxID=1080221 RepID=UPI000783B852|nr:hypothetical protein [Aquimarina longa]